MTKDEILKISRKENSVSDERTEYIGLKGANFSVSILILFVGYSFTFYSNGSSCEIRNGTFSDGNLLFQLAVSADSG